MPGSVLRLTPLAWMLPGALMVALLALVLGPVGAAVVIGGGLVWIGWLARGAPEYNQGKG